MKPNIAARLGGWSARHRKTAILGWLLFVVAAVLIGGMVGQKQLTGGEEGTGDSGRAERIISDAGIKSPASEMVLVHSAAVNGFRAALPDVTQAIRSTGQATAIREPIVSRDGHDALIQFDMSGDPETAADRVTPVVNAVSAVRPRIPTCASRSSVTPAANKWFNDTMGKDFHRAEMDRRAAGPGHPARGVRRAGGRAAARRCSR